VRHFALDPTIPLSKHCALMTLFRSARPMEKLGFNMWASAMFFF